LTIALSGHSHSFSIGERGCERLAITDPRIDLLTEDFGDLSSMDDREDNLFVCHFGANAVPRAYIFRSSPIGSYTAQIVGEFLTIVDNRARRLEAAPPG
jgi:hypothetical protein